MSDNLPGLSSSFCDSSVCHVGRALQAFSWLSWVGLTAMLALLITSESMSLILLTDS